MIKKLRPYLRSIKEYWIIKEDINKSFFLSKKKIKNNSFPLTIIEQNEKQVEFSEKLISRMRNILSNEIIVSGHWTDMYNLGDKKSILQELIESNDKQFYEIVSNPQNSRSNFFNTDFISGILNCISCL